MRSFHSTLFALVIAGASAGCGTTSSPTEPVGESHARLVLSMSGHGSTSVRITARDEASAAAVIDESADVTAGEAVVLSFDVPASSYAFHVAVFADAAQTKLIGSADAHAALDAGATTEIKLAAAVDAGGSADVSVGVNEAPEIDDVDVEVTGGADGSIAIHVDASDAEGGALTFFWSGAGISGTVVGSATIDLSTAAVLAAGSSGLHVVVQDAAGATAAADIAIDVAAGTASETPCDPADPCFEANAQCVASCDASLVIDPLAIVAHASCMADCGLSLASCHH